MGRVWIGMVSAVLLLGCGGGRTGVSIDESPDAVAVAVIEPSEGAVADGGGAFASLSSDGGAALDGAGSSDATGSSEDTLSTVITNCPPVCEEAAVSADPMILLGEYQGPDFVEIVDVVADPSRSVVHLCTGVQGLLTVDVSAPSQPVSLWGTGAFGDVFGPEKAKYRCQHAAVMEGVSDATGAPVAAVAVTHHGDSTAVVPFLRVVAPPLDRPPTPDQPFLLPDIAEISEPGVMYEGLDFANGHLFVTAHDLGLRVYRLEEGALLLVSTLDEFVNALDVRVEGDIAYVVDGHGLLVAVDISEPTQPVVLDSLAVEGAPKQLDVGPDGRVVLAAGASGLHVVDASDPSELILVSTLVTYGSVTAVAADGERVHIANWNDLVTVDLSEPSEPFIVAEEQGTSNKSFPRFLAVDAVDGIVYGGEWTGLLTFEFVEGAVSPEVRFYSPELNFGDVSEEGQTMVLVVLNDGFLPLEVALPDFKSGKMSGVPDSLTIPPQGADVFELTMNPHSKEIHNTLWLTSNDPDEAKVPLRITANLPGANIGDPFPSGHFEDMATGTLLASPDMFMGKVTLLAYFATF